MVQSWIYLKQINKSRLTLRPDPYPETRISERLVGGLFWLASIHPTIIQNTLATTYCSNELTTTLETLATTQHCPGKQVGVIVVARMYIKALFISQQLLSKMWSWHWARIENGRVFRENTQRRCWLALCFLRVYCGFLWMCIIQRMGSGDYDSKAMMKEPLLYFLLHLQPSFM